MASLEKRGNTYRIVFRYGGQKWSRSLRTRDEKAATACLARLEDNLRRLELGLLTLSDHADVAKCLLSDGLAQAKPAPRSSIRTLGDLLDKYVDSIAPGSMEETTLAGMRIHVRRLKCVLGGKTLLADFRSKTCRSTSRIAPTTREFEGEISARQRSRKNFGR